MSDYKSVLCELSKNSEAGVAIRNIFKKFTMPNIPMYTMGGKVFWENVGEYRGWRVQTNTIMQQMRILDPNDLRIAWGTIPGMTKALAYAMDYIDKNVKNNSKPDEGISTVEKLKQIKELFELGILDEYEYSEKRAKLIKEL